MSAPLATRDGLIDSIGLDAQLGSDLALLDTAGRQWRWLGWLWFFGGVVLSIPFIARVIVVAVNGNNLGRVLWASASVAIVLALFLGIANLYFFLGWRIARGKRWAVGVALFLAAIAAGATGFRICFRIVHKQQDISGMILDSLLLIAHLNLLKLLIRSWSATRRVHLVVGLRLEAQELAATRPGIDD